MRGPCPAAASTSARGSRSRSKLASARLQAEAIDFTPEGLGVAVVGQRRDDAGGGRGRHRPLHGRGRSGAGSRPWCATSAACRPRRGTLPRLGLSLVATTRVADVERPGRPAIRPDALPAFAAAACPWFFRETLRFRIVAVGAGGMTVPDDAAPLLPGAELDFDLHLRVVGVGPAAGA